MKKFISTLIILNLFIQSFCQTTITELPPTYVKSLQVKPVRFEGNNEWFFFEGFYGSHTGCFGLNSGDIVLTRCDKFDFEFAEYYTGNTNIPLYYIKRGDGVGPRTLL
ncbi:MAG TPA: hypothetical protein VK588_07150 [Chitinophagaceae bacterium]|nr:hypothetical protein [Chitinophagaceae bacterium]